MIWFLEDMTSCVFRTDLIAIVFAESRKELFEQSKPSTRQLRILDAWSVAWYIDKFSRLKQFVFTQSHDGDVVLFDVHKVDVRLPRVRSLLSTDLLANDPALLNSIWQYVTSLSPRLNACSQLLGVHCNEFRPTSSKICICRRVSLRGIVAFRIS